MNILSYFQTTNKGIYTMSELPKTSTITRAFFGISLGLEIMFLLLIIGIFGLSIYRSVKKIKNVRFKVEKEEENEEDQEIADNGTQVKETNDNLIYRFDEEDNEKQKKNEGEGVKKQEDDDNSEDDYENAPVDNEDSFIEIDDQILFFQPFLISHIISTSIFSASYITLGLMGLTMIFFGIFNLKKVGSSVKILSMLFMLPAIGSFVPIFLDDHNMST